MPELTCPVCGGVLHREERSLRCGAGHCYDIARQGYVNLLRSNQSKSKRHGDDKRMVAARLVRQPPASLVVSMACVQISRPYRSLRGSSAASGSTPSYSARP